MAVTVKVTPPGLRATAGHLDEVIAKLQKIRDDVVALDARSAGCFGTDDIGLEYEPAFRSSLENFKDDFDGKIQLLKNYRDDLNNSAGWHDTTEDTNRRDMDVRT